MHLPLRCTLTANTADTRREVPITEAITVEDAGKLDIDHVVPLPEAWESGTSAWTVEQRVAYANDLQAVHHLMAVTACGNRQKADRDVADRLPHQEPIRCRYIAEWTAIRHRRQLSVDAREKQALVSITVSCPDLPLDAQPAV
ncbi:DUF1524 domain-containing protein [Nonomuraea sp. NPDC050404]|uniref:GmrSD restriction endonuclease domain-containing protein n=1 Tax=Nonomuraea sp. NPDC050404 TaxID=3155783 RepID=UPI0033D8EF08